MGIRRLSTFLRRNYPGIYKPIHVSKIADARIAVDISIYIFKYKSLHGRGWSLAFLNLILFFRQNNIHPVFIYDVGHPPEKSSERCRRSKQKKDAAARLQSLRSAIEKRPFSTYTPSSRSPSYLSGSSPEDEEYERKLRRISALESTIVEVDRHDFDLSKVILEKCGVPYFNAVLEAETVCADLAKKGIVTAAMSEDSDLFVYGSPLTIIDVNLLTQQVTTVAYKDILNELKMTEDQFLNFCMLCGCDYVRSTFRDPKDAYDLVMSHSPISLPEHVSDMGTFLRARKMYIQYEGLDGVTEIPPCKPYDRELYENLYDELELRSRHRNVS